MTPPESANGLRAAWQRADGAATFPLQEQLTGQPFGALYNVFDYRSLRYERVGANAHTVLDLPTHHFEDDPLAAWQRVLPGSLVTVFKECVLPDLLEHLRTAASHGGTYHLYLSYATGQEAPFPVVDHRIRARTDPRTGMPTRHQEWILRTARRVRNPRIDVLLGLETDGGGLRAMHEQTYRPDCIFDTALSDREQQIARLLLKGLDSVAIGQQLFISKHTVDTHRRALLRKVDVSNTHELLSLAARLEWGR